MRLRYRAPSSPDCEHPGLQRTVAEGCGFLWEDAAVFDCPDCGYRNYGDVGSYFDGEVRESFGL